MISKDLQQIKHDEAAQIAKEVQAFLAKGGVIEQVPYEPLQRKAREAHKYTSSMSLT